MLTNNRNGPLKNKKYHSCELLRLVMAIICLSVFTLITIAVIKVRCETGFSANEYCLCNQYSYKDNDKGIYDCELIQRDEANMAKCLMDTGYFLCQTEITTCPMSQSKLRTHHYGLNIHDSWGDCAYHESEKENLKITTCDTRKLRDKRIFSVKGIQRCFKENGTCCWFP